MGPCINWVGNVFSHPEWVNCVVIAESYDWLGCWGHHMKSPGFKAIGEHQKVIFCRQTPADVLADSDLMCLFFCCSWTTSREPFRSAGRTGFGGICPRCSFTSANRSLTFSRARSSFLTTSSCSVRPGKIVAPSKSGLSNLYVLHLCNIM